MSIVLMFVHHFFTFPAWYVDGVCYPRLAGFADFFCLPTKLCVSIFAFLTGYLYVAFRKGSYRYSLKKIADLLISYWVVFIPMLLLALVCGTEPLCGQKILLEAFALERSIMVFCWYIPFYIALMLLLPVATKLFTGSLLLDAAVLLVEQGILTVLANRVQIPYLTETLGSVASWFMIVMAGCLVAKYELYDRVFDPVLMGRPPRFMRLPIAAGMVVVPFLLQNKTLTGRLFGLESGPLDDQRMLLVKALVIPVFLYGLLQILAALRGTILFRVLVQLGKVSMSMWFLHCIFFNVCKETFQPILYGLKNPVLVLLFGCAVCWLAARVLEPVRSVLVKKANQLLRFETGSRVSAAP